MSNTLTVLLMMWGAALSVAVMYLLWMQNDVDQWRKQVDVLLRKLQESGNAFAAAVERAAARAGRVKKPTGAKGK